MHKRQVDGLRYNDVVVGEIFAWDGLYERALAFGKLGWFVTMGVMIWRDPDIVRRVPEDERS